jgi:hypothetical protein
VCLRADKNDNLPENLFATGACNATTLRSFRTCRVRSSQLTEMPRRRRRTKMKKRRPSFKYSAVVMNRYLWYRYRYVIYTSI